MKTPSRTDGSKRPAVQALVLFGLIFLITRIQFAMEKKVVHYQ